MGCVRISFQVVPTWGVYAFHFKSYRRGVYAFFKSSRTDVVCTHFSSQVVPTWCVRIFQVKSYRRGVYAFFKSSRTVCTHFIFKSSRTVCTHYSNKSSQVVQCVRIIQDQISKVVPEVHGAQVKSSSFWRGKEKKRKSPKASIVLGGKEKKRKEVLKTIKEDNEINEETKDKEDNRRGRRRE